MWSYILLCFHIVLLVNSIFILWSGNDSVAWFVIRLVVYQVNILYVLYVLQSLNHWKYYSIVLLFSRMNMYQSVKVLVRQALFLSLVRSEVHGEFIQLNATSSQWHWSFVMSVIMSLYVRCVCACLHEMCVRANVCVPMCVCVKTKTSLKANLVHISFLEEYSLLYFLLACWM